MNYTWDITNKKKIDQGNFKNVIVQVYWSKIGTDVDGRSGSFNGCCSFELDEERGFVEYEDVDNHMIYSWIEDFVASSEGLEEKMNLEIYNQINGIEPEKAWR